MPARTSKCIDIATEISRINKLRSAMILKAFALLEQQHPPLAQMLLQSFGNRQRAAHWMCTYQRAFDGRSAYEVLEDGEEDRVWDEISHATKHSYATALIDVRMAY